MVKGASWARGRAPASFWSRAASWAARIFSATVRMARSGSAKLIAVTGDVTRRPLTRKFETWDSRSGPFTIGPFTVTPILTDHSAFDAYMLLVEGAGKRLLYTGDFRRHGRKHSLVDQLIADPPANIDVLLTEGTNLGSDKPVKSESELESDFVELFERTRGRVFVAWSGQNIDRQ
jgi:ribonuclease J